MFILDCWDPDPDDRCSFDELLRDLIGMAINPNSFGGLAPPPTLADAIKVHFDQTTGTKSYAFFQDYAGYEVPVDSFDGSGGDASSVGVDDYAFPADQRAASAASQISAAYTALQGSSTRHSRPATLDAQDGYSAALLADDLYCEPTSPFPVILVSGSPTANAAPGAGQPAALLQDDLYSDAADDFVASLEPGTLLDIVYDELGGAGDEAEGGTGTSTPPLYAVPMKKTKPDTGHRLPATILDSNIAAASPPSTSVPGAAPASIPSVVTERAGDELTLSSYRRFAQLKTYVNWPLDPTPPEPATGRPGSGHELWYRGPTTPIEVRFEVPPLQPTLVSSKHYVLIRPAGSDREFKIELEDTIEPTDAHRQSLLKAVSCAFSTGVKDAVSEDRHKVPLLDGQGYVDIPLAPLKL